MNAALGLLKRTKPNIASLEMQRTKRAMALLFSKTTLVAAPDKQVFVKDFGKLRVENVANNQAPAGNARRGVRPGVAGQIPAVGPNQKWTADMQNFHGQWSADGSKYQITVSDKGAWSASVEGDRLIVNGDQYPIVFDREY